MSKADIILLIDFECYRKRYYEYTLLEKTNQKAWERVEKDVKKATGRCRYSSYDSFRTVLARKLKK